MSVHFTLKNHENRSGSKVIKPTVNLVRSVLERLNYGGVWGLTFVSQVRNRTERRWQSIRCDADSVIVRTKPGGNESCWELALLPPKNYKPTDVFEKFNQIHPQKLSEVLPNSQPSIKILGQEVTLQSLATNTNRGALIALAQTMKDREDAALQNKIQNTLQDFYIIVEEESDKIPEPEPIARPAASVMQYVKKEEEDFANLLQQPAETFSLAIQPTWGIHDPRVVQNALVAACMSLDPRSNHAPRKIVVATVQNELHLANYIALNPFGYKSKLGLIREIIAVLCDRGLLNRYAYKKKSHSTVRQHTIGYVLTPEAIEKIEKLKSFMPPAVLERLFTGEYEDFSNKFIILNKDYSEDVNYSDLTPESIAETKSETKAASPNETIGLIASKLSQLTPLMDRHDKLVADLKEYDNLIEPARNNAEAKGYIVEGIKAKLVPIQKELERLQKQLEEATKSFQEADEEVSYIIAEKEEAEENLDEIRSQLKELLA